MVNIVNLWGAPGKANDRPVINAAKRRAANDHTSTAKGARKRKRARERGSERGRARGREREADSGRERGRAREGGERRERARASQEKKRVTDSLLASEEEDTRHDKDRRGKRSPGAQELGN